jgi:hypothetical protein
MDILDALTVNGPLKIAYWKEVNDDANMPARGEYYWRQTYHHDTNILSVSISYSMIQSENRCHATPLRCHYLYLYPECSGGSGIGGGDDSGFELCDDMLPCGSRRDDGHKHVFVGDSVFGMLEAESCFLRCLRMRSVSIPFFHLIVNRTPIMNIPSAMSAVACYRAMAIIQKTSDLCVIETHLQWIPL